MLLDVLNRSISQASTSIPLMEGTMKDLTVAALTLTVLGTMFIATVRSGSTGTDLARAEGYTSSAELVLDISMAQLGATVPAR
jgi:hypothetical protein